MANVIKHKRGSGSDPVASDLVVGEVAIRTDVGKLFTKMDNGTVAEIAGGGSDIAINTLSSSSGTGGGSATFNGSAYRFTLSAPPSVSAQQLLVSINGVIQKPVAGTGQPSEGFSVDGTDIILGDAPATGSDFFILTFKSLGVSEPADNSVTSAKIVDGAIVNADVNASAAIAGSKISPDFGSQAISTTGTLACGDITSSDGNGNLTLKDNNHTGNNTEHKISFTASDNTELINFISPFGEQHLRLRHGSTELVKFQVDGKVGIGTTSPQKLLDVRGEFAISNSNASYWDFDRDDSDGSLKIKDTGTERMRIDTSGNLTLGGFTPPTDLSSAAMPSLFIDSNKNNIFGTSTSLFFTQNAYFNTGNSYQYVAAAAASQYKQESGGHIFLTATTGSAGADFTFSERMRIDSSGNVGIGTTSPGAVLHVNDSANNGDGSLKIGGTNTSTGGQLFYEISGATYLRIKNLYRSNSSNGNNAYIEYDGGYHKFMTGTSGTERMRIDSSGKVGIGTSSPTDKLHVVGDVEFSVGSSLFDVMSTGSGSKHPIRLLNADASAGNEVGIQFGPANNVVAASIQAIAESDFTSSANRDGALSFTTRLNGTLSEAMRIDSSGRVMIGATSYNTGNMTSGATGINVAGTSPQVLLHNTNDDKDSFFGMVGSNLFIFSADSIPIVFGTNDAERMRLTGDGPHLLLGGTSDVNEITETSANAGMVIGGTGFGNAGLAIITSTSGTGRLYFGDNTGNNAGRNRGQINYGHSDDHMRFVTASSERMRIDSSGNVGIGQSPSYRLDVIAGQGAVSRFRQATNNQGITHACIMLRHQAANSSQQGVGMVFQNSSGGEVGSIRFGASTSYNTTSDYRLKENVVAISDGITRLKTLKPSRFNWKGDTSFTVDGFLAHEVTAVPEAITGSKDQVDSDNNPVYQSIDQSKLVPLLVAALQEAIDRIEVLEAK